MIATGDAQALFSELLPDLEEATARQILGALGEADAPVIRREPATGLVMMRIRDCFGTEFHLGEVLVTQAEVDVDGTPGHGTVMGDAPARALLAAVVDALGRSARADLRAAVTGALAEARAALPSEREREGTLAARTRVRFETMPEG